nr:isochorismatase family protein [Stackebrandtia endophytica]
MCNETSAKAAPSPSPVAPRSPPRSPSWSARTPTVGTTWSPPRDYHIDPGHHFSTEPDFVNTWPPHCVVGTEGAQIHPNMTVTPDAVFDKGAYAAAYSGFEGASGDTGLAEWLRDHEVDTVDVVGIATDHCVRATALDAAAEGLATTVLLDFTAAVAAPTTETSLTNLREAGVTLEGTPHVG